MACEDWPIVRLGDFIEVTHGFAFKTKYANGEPAPYALFTRKNVALGGGFREDGPRYYHSDFDARFALEPGDLMLVLTDLSKNGDLLGLPAVVPRVAGIRYLHNQRVGKVLFRRDGIDRRFLYMLLRSPDYRRHVLTTASQTTVRDTAPSRLHEYRFRLPHLREQKGIAETLAAVDDKIDSGRRLARLLEETATTLFRARFVDFVGVEEFEDSEIGRVPRGWRQGTLADLVEQRREPGTDHAAYIGLDDMPRGSTVLELWKTTNAPSGISSRFERGDILFGKLRPYFKKVGVAPIDGRCSTEIVALRPRAPELFGLSIGHLTSSRFFDHCDAVSTGTRMPRAEWKLASQLPLVLPKPDALIGFNDWAKAAYKQIVGLTHETHTLAAVRDVLLPKLISGEIRVLDTSDPEEVIGPAAERLAGAEK